MKVLKSVSKACLCLIWKDLTFVWKCKSSQSIFPSWWRNNQPHFQDTTSILSILMVGSCCCAKNDWTLCAKEERTMTRAELLLSNGSRRLHICRHRHRHRHRWYHHHYNDDFDHLGPNKADLLDVTLVCEDDSKVWLTDFLTNIQHPTSHLDV